MQATFINFPKFYQPKRGVYKIPLRGSPSA